jgi:alpha-galactosidase
MSGCRAKRRADLSAVPEVKNLAKDGPAPAAVFPDSLIQAHLRGDGLPTAFAGGLTLRHSGTVESLKLSEQHVEKSKTGIEILTQMVTPAGVRFDHTLRWSRGESGVRISTRCINATRRAVTLDLLASFSLGGITPFDPADATGRIVFHRFRSFWSAEGRLESRLLEELHLERSWIGHSQLCERFGSIGSMPVRQWFPFAALEDTAAGVTWAAQIAWAGSWQLEVFRRGDTIALSGGLADREFGHWSKKLAPGEEFSTPEAWLTVAAGGLEAAAQRLQSLHRSALATWPASEQKLAIVANEFCTTWGNPTHDSLIALADRLRGTPVKVLVIDAGWAERKNGSEWEHNGDWVIDKSRFPHGLSETATQIRRRGLIPGLWFEFEVCTLGSKAWKKKQHQLRRDGHILQVGKRRFWDFRNPWVHEMLAEKVIRTLRENRIGYLKVDYNDTIGLGCDGADSLGEGLRQHIEGVQSFFRTLRSEIPDLIIENCSSGGHRTEPSMIGLSAMTSFSDAHEVKSIPIIAANLHYLIPPRQSQVWAVLRQSDDPRRLSYSLCATLLGRMCLSGDLPTLSTKSWSQVVEIMDFYRSAAPIIRDGISRRFGPPVRSYGHPKGWQAVVRQGKRSTLLVFHSFESCPEKSLEISLPQGVSKIARFCGDSKIRAKASGGKIRLSGLDSFQGWAALLE